MLTSHFSSAVRYCRGSTIRFIRCGSPSFSCTDVCLLSSTQHIVLNCRPCPNGTDVIESRMVIKYLAHCQCATIFGRPANLFSSHFRLYTTDHGRKCDNMKPPVTHSERFLFFSRQIFEYFVGLCIFVVFFFQISHRSGMYLPFLAYHFFRCSAYCFLFFPLFFFFLVSIQFFARQFLPYLAF